LIGTEVYDVHLSLSTGAVMSLAVPTRLTRPVLARLTGAAYVAYIATSVLADAVAHIGLGSAQQVVASLSESPALFRIGLASALVSGLLFVLAAWGLYVLLRPVNADLALLLLLLNALGVAVQCASLLQIVWAMQLAADPGAPAQAIALAAAQTYRIGLVTAQLFFGAWLFPLGYLVLRSGLLPRFLGFALLLDGVGEAVWFSQALLLPGHPEISIPGTLVSLVAEVGLASWLLIRGVTADQPAAHPVPVRDLG
jgi:hypothetical protein